ncbi:hypothetical protein L218DRAFT_878882 [Marasmius fiardii PR-910]|nr:hypothetical protein L218DRAFT_878882 [Marasmius fiardii PR-910]
MTIIHIVQFSFKPTTTPEQINEVCQGFLALKEKCINPITKQPYLKSVVGGRDNSPEKRQGGMTHGFVFEFENSEDEDRNYFLTQDPAHLEFAKFVMSFVDAPRVMDFIPGKF